MLTDTSFDFKKLLLNVTINITLYFRNGSGVFLVFGRVSWPMSWFCYADLATLVAGDILKARYRWLVIFFI